MIKVNITDDQWQRARKLYEFSVLNQSFTQGQGNMTGALGEIIVQDTWSSKLMFPTESSYHYDLVSKCGNKKIDVKSKKVSNHVVPKGDFKVTISHSQGLGINQKCDWYVFCFITKDYKTGYIVGWYKKDEFIRDGIFKRKGDVDDIGNVLNAGWTFKVDTHLMLIKDLVQIETFV